MSLLVTRSYYCKESIYQFIPLQLLFFVSYLNLPYFEVMKVFSMIFSKIYCFSFYVEVNSFPGISFCAWYKVGVKFLFFSPHICIYLTQTSYWKFLFPLLCRATFVISQKSQVPGSISESSFVPFVCLSVTAEHHTVIISELCKNSLFLVGQSFCLVFFFF